MILFAFTIHGPVPPSHMDQYLRQTWTSTSIKHGPVPPSNPPKACWVASSGRLTSCWLLGAIRDVQFKKQESENETAALHDYPSELSSSSQTRVLLFSRSRSPLSRLRSGVGSSAWPALLLGSYRVVVGEFCMTTRRMGDWLGGAGVLSGAYSLVGSLPRQSYKMQEMRKTSSRIT